MSDSVDTKRGRKLAIKTPEPPSIVVSGTDNPGFEPGNDMAVCRIYKTRINTKYKLSYKSCLLLIAKYESERGGYPG